MKYVTLVAIAATLAMSSIAMALPFDDPFTGTVDIEIVSMSLSGTENFGTGPITFNVNRTGSSPGSLTIDGTRTVTAGNAPVDIMFSVPAAGANIPVALDLTMSNDPFNSFPLPGSPPSFPLGATDPVPPLVSELNGAFQDEAFAFTSGLSIGAYQLALNNLVTAVPVPGGVEYTYDAFMAIPGEFSPPLAPITLPVVFGLGGQVTFLTTPEPTMLMGLALAGLPLMLRRRRA